MKRFAGSLLLPMILAAFSSCAKLNICVDVYKGDLLLDNDAKIARAVGAAKQAYEYARAYVKLKRAQDETQKLLATYVSHCIQVYKDERIEEKWAAFSKLNPPRFRKSAPLSANTQQTNNQSNLEQSPHAASSFSSADEIKSYYAARHELSMSLLRFGATCNFLGQERGLPPALGSRAALGLSLLPEMAGGEPTALKVGIDMEQVGMAITLLVNDVEDTSQRQTISHLMQSVTPQSVALAINGKSSNALIGALSWAHINDIHVGGIGDEQYVIVKDEVGNWHIKSLTSNQTAVVDALFDSTTSIVNVVASHYGFSLGSNSSDSADTSSSGPSNPPPANTSNQSEVLLAQANESQAELSRAKNALRATLTAALAQGGPTLMQQQASDAVTLYSSQINAITIPSADSSAGNTATTPAATNTGGTGAATGSAPGATTVQPK